MKDINRNRKLRRKFRVSKNIYGTKDKPRISIFRSCQHIYAQAIDDEKKITLASSSTLFLKKNNKVEVKMTKKEVSRLVGLDLAKKLKKLKIKKAVFDRGPYHYHGRVAVLASGLREGGIKI